MGRHGAACREEAELLDGEADGGVLRADGLLEEHEQLAPLLTHRARQCGLATRADEAQDARGQLGCGHERDEEVVNARGDGVEQGAPARGALGRLRALAAPLEQLQGHLQCRHVDRVVPRVEAARDQLLARLLALGGRLVQARRQRLRRRQQRAQQLPAVLRSLWVLGRDVVEKRGHQVRVGDPRAARVGLRRLRRHAGLQGGRLPHAEREQHRHDRVRAHVQQQAGQELRHAATRQAQREGGGRPARGALHPPPPHLSPLLLALARSPPAPPARSCCTQPAPAAH